MSLFLLWHTQIELSAIIYTYCSILNFVLYFFDLCCPQLISYHLLFCGSKRCKESLLISLMFHATVICHHSFKLLGVVLMRSVTASFGLHNTERLTSGLRSCYIFQRFPTFGSDNWCCGSHWNRYSLFCRS